MIGTQHFNRTIPIESFTIFEGGGPGQLDLSSNASPLTFGYIDYNDSGVRNRFGSFISSNTTQLSGFHLSIAFTAVPEPSGFVLFAVCFVVLFGTRLRTYSTSSVLKLR